jgi:hypothetical protein
MDETLTPETIAMRLEDEVDAAEKEAANAVLPVHIQQLGPGGSLPISDLAQRLRLLSDAWVEVYSDGPLQIRFDIEGRRAHVQKTEGTSGNNTPQW